MPNYPNNNLIPQQQGLQLNSDFPVLQNNPADVVPPNDRGDITLDEDHLKARLLETFEFDIRDKEEFGWAEKRKYDIESYYEIKNENLSNFPWKGSSSFRNPLTPTLLDTAVANIKASIWAENGDSVKVIPQGVEDTRIAPILESYMNWKVNNEIQMEPAIESAIFRAFHNGTSFLKVIRDFKNNVSVISFDSENLYVPVDAKGIQPEDTDRVTHIIPLSYNDIQLRKQFYRNIENISPGIGLGFSNINDTILFAKDIATGTSMMEKYRRETFFIAETYITYFPKDSYRSKELIVWWSPKGMTLHRIKENKEGFRPFADFHSYKNHGRFWSMSLGEKIRPIQEKLDYADKQNTDALDRAISPALFMENTDEFDPRLDQRVPGGIYKIGKDNKIQSEPQAAVEKGFERQLQYLWDLAERLTGIIDITQGRQSNGGRTLGETRIRTSRADIRFSNILDRFENGWKRTMELIYEYSNRYESRDKKLKVLGYRDFRKISEIFPNEDLQLGLGLTGKFDFRFGGSSIADRETERENKIQFYRDMIMNPLFQNPASIWKITNDYAEAIGRKDFSTLVSKPKEVGIYGIDEFIQRVMSGEYDIQIRPGIDTNEYVFELMLFMKTDTFQSLDMQAQQTLTDTLRRAYMMQVAENRALTDAHLALGGAGAGQFGGGAQQPNLQQITQQPAAQLQ